MSNDRADWPPIVRVGLYGLTSRNSAWTWFWVSVIFAVGSIAYGLVNPFALFGGVFLFASLWYYLSIRWVDRHSTWDSPEI
ncbi:MAG: hypothetical protein WDZ51_11080 [Pirellulaceae bacterium]